MGSVHDKSFPGESAAYRAARDTLLAAEAVLRKQIEEVAALRRALPPGGTVPCDYRFQAAPGGAPALMLELFAPGRDTLDLYSYMYGPQAPAPCPLCTSMLDSLDGAAPHVAEHVNLAVVARASADKLQAVAEQRGWRHLRLVSSCQNSYQPHYLGEDEAGNQWSMLNVFRHTEQGLIHTLGQRAAVCAAPGRPAQSPRRPDLAPVERARPNARRPRHGLATPLAVPVTGLHCPCPTYNDPGRRSEHGFAMHFRGLAHRRAAQLLCRFHRAEVSRRRAARGAPPGRLRHLLGA